MLGAVIRTTFDGLLQTASVNMQTFGRRSHQCQLQGEGGLVQPQSETHQLRGERRPATAYNGHWPNLHSTAPVGWQRSNAM
jgi:hypothetical protein